MADKILTFNGKTISGPSGTGMAIVRGPATMTIRFKFTWRSSYDIYDPSDYDPTEYSWFKGKWTLVEYVEEDEHNGYSIWDWTYTGTNASMAFYKKFTNFTNTLEIEILDITCTSEITNVSRMFEDCSYIEYGIINAYTKLSKLNLVHKDCFKNCGIEKANGADSLIDIPEDWGGLKPLTGNEGIKVGNYVWGSYSIGQVNIPNMVTISENSDFEPGTIGYMNNNGFTYYTIEAILYMIEHPEVLPSGWHVPTYEEASDFADTLNHHYLAAKCVYNTRGNHGFNIGLTQPDDIGGEITYDSECVLDFEPDILNEWLRGYIKYPYPVTEENPPTEGNDEIRFITGDTGYFTLDVCYSGITLQKFDPPWESEPYSWCKTGTLFTVRLVRDHD